MIPIRDVIPSPAWPAATLALIAIQVGVWLGQALLAPERPLPFLPESSGVGFLHLVGNTWALWLFGETLENRLGRGAFLSLYLLAGVLAALTAAALHPGAPAAAGSSGATAAVAGAYLALYPRSRVLTVVPLGATWDVVEVPGGWLIAVWCGLQLLTSGALSAPAAGGSAALAAIAGSLAAGTAAGLVLRRKQRAFPAW